MALKKIFKTEEGVKRIESFVFDADDAPEAEIYVPISVTEMNSFIVDNTAKTAVRVYYGGTTDMWQKIKKGRLKRTVVKHDWYGYYYHNVNTEPTVTEDYYNWIGLSKSVTIVCADGEIADDAAENMKNPLIKDVSEYWDDD